MVSQADYQAHESQSVLEKLYGDSLKKFVTSLYHGKKISSEEIQDLSEFLQGAGEQRGIANYGGFCSAYSKTEHYCSSCNFTGQGTGNFV